jgi:hypothetical protein
VEKDKKSKKDKKDKKSGAQPVSGSHKAGIQRTLGRLPEKKLRNILKHSGAKAAMAYVKEELSGSTALLRKISQESTFAGRVAREALS